MTFNVLVASSVNEIQLLKWPVVIGDGKVLWNCYETRQQMFNPYIVKNNRGKYCDSVKIFKHKSAHYNPISLCHSWMG